MKHRIAISVSLLLLFLHAGAAQACNCPKGIPHCVICCPEDFLNAIVANPASVADSLDQIQNMPPEFRAKFQPVLDTSNKVKVLAGDTSLGAKQVTAELEKKIDVQLTVSNVMDEAKLKLLGGHAALHREGDSVKGVNDEVWDNVFRSGASAPAVQVSGFSPDGTPQLDRALRPAPAAGLASQGIRLSNPPAGAGAVDARDVRPPLTGPAREQAQRVLERVQKEGEPRPQPATQIHYHYPDPKKSSEPPPPKPVPPKVEQTLKGWYMDQIHHAKERLGL